MPWFSMNLNNPANKPTLKMCIKWLVGLPFTRATACPAGFLLPLSESHRVSGFTVGQESKWLSARRLQSWEMKIRPVQRKGPRGAWKGLSASGSPQSQGPWCEGAAETTSESSPEAGRDGTNCSGLQERECLVLSAGATQGSSQTRNARGW